MGQEFELKYTATAGQQAAIRAAWPGPWRTLAMETTYYDTPSGDLAARHITLRLRLENGRPICTVKTPSAEPGRGEWECACGDIGQAVPLLLAQGCPAELAALVQPGLTTVCGARFTRQALLLPLDGGTVELALDSGVLLGGGGELPLSEVEVEQKTGGIQATIAFAEALAATFALTPEKESKFRRAMALAKGDANGTGKTVSNL